jgi:hypothetical protein
VIAITLPINQIVKNINSTGKQGERDSHSNDLNNDRDIIPSMVEKYTDKDKAIL